MPTLRHSSAADLDPPPVNGSLRTPFPGLALLVSYARFVRAGLVHRGQTGALVPSQRFLTAAMVAPISPDYAGELVELGAGTGALTLQLADRCPAARILACEINPSLAEAAQNRLEHEHLEKRVELFTGPAETLLQRWQSHATPKPRYIVSGIPLGSLKGAKVCQLLDAIRNAIAEGGCYIQFQHSLLDRKRIQERFRAVKTVPVALNIPPAVVYIARP